MKVDLSKALTWLAWVGKALARAATTGQEIVADFPKSE